MPRNGISPQGDRKSVHINSQIREGKNAVIHHHLSGHEGFRHNVRKFYVSEVDHTRGEATVTVGEPRGDSWTVRPNNIEYWTVERDGAVIYDSRLDIPCDMEEYERAAARYQGREPPPSKPVTHQDLSAFKIKFMTDLPNWVCWRWEKKHSGFTKVPYIAGTIGPNSLKADSGLKATWRPHDVALESVRRGYDGIGFCLLESGVGAFDIDNCIDDAGAIHPWALALVKRAKSYTERTVGGKGLRIIGKTGTRELQSKHKVAGTPISVECYRWAVRFITISGLHLQGTPNELNSIDALLDEVHAELAGGTTASHTEPKPREQNNSPKTKWDTVNDYINETDKDEIAAALKVIKIENLAEDMTYQVWFEIASALRRDLGDDGLELFDHWSAAATDVYNAKETAKKWREVKGVTGYGLGTIFHYANSIDPEWKQKWQDSKPKPPPKEDKPPKPPLIIAKPFILRDPSQIPQRDWIYGNHLIRRFGSATIAPGGVGKSSLIIVEALAMATGRALLGITPTQVCKVWLWNGEDPLEEIERRIAAACLHFGITAQEIEGQLFVNSGRDSEIIIATQTRDGIKIAVPMVEALERTIMNNKIDVVQIDPFISSHRVTENDNGAIDLVAKTWTKLSDRTNTAIDLVHHARKTGGAEVTIEDGRGASAMINAVRSSRALNTMSEAEAEKAGVASRRGYFRIDDGKMNLAPPSDTAKWLQLQSIELGNGPPHDPFEGGDKVGVVTEWTWPDPLEDVSEYDVEKVFMAIRAGRWREDSQAKDWVGYAVANAMGLYLDDKADKTKVKGLIKIWIKAGKLTRVTGMDDQRKPKTFVEVAEDSEAERTTASEGQKENYDFGQKAYNRRTRK